MRVYPANQAQIIRCAQRDGDAINTLQIALKQAIGELTGNAGMSSKFTQAALPLFARLCYYGSTTLSGNQTLGEEYVGAVLSHHDLTSPSKLKFIWIVLLRVLGADALHYAIRVWDLAQKRERQNNDNSLEKGKLILIFKEMSSLLEVLRKGIFYLTGQLYDIGMWTTGVHYVLVRAWLENSKLSHYFKLMGILTILHFLFTATVKWKKLQELQDSEEDHSVEEVGSKIRCHLCLEIRKNTSATPCGHLFCWTCIIDAVRISNVCPLCREKVIPSRIVMLQNYDL